MIGETAQPARSEGLRVERDRFVALAFCWADMMLELDGNRRVTYAAGVTDALLGEPPSALIGRGLRDLVAPADHDLLAELLRLAEHHGRIEDVSLRLRGRRGAELRLQVAGYCLPDLGGHVFLSFRLGARPTEAVVAAAGVKPVTRDHDTGLFEADSFSQVAAGRLKEAAPARMTLLALDHYADLRQRLDAEGERHLQRLIGTTLKAHSVDGDSAVRIAADRYGLLHASDVDVAEMENRINGYARAVDPAGQGAGVQSATIALDPGTISERDLATGLIYTINNFRKSRGHEFTLKTLSANMGDLAAKAVQSLDGFKKAVARQDFEVVFQPVVDLARGKPHHFEALARFPHMIGKESPYNLITFAEQTDLIRDFDMAMTKRMLAWLGQNSPQGEYRIAVNLSGASISTFSFVAELHELLKQNPWSKKTLLFEVTESSEIKDIQAANRVIQSLRQAGHPVCLDDFGAGAANFQYLTALEVDVVKLDGQALRTARYGAKGKAFLKALATLCVELGIEVIAEMVDDLQGLQFVRDCNIRYVQGYLYGKPSDDITTFGDTSQKVWK